MVMERTHSFPTDYARRNEEGLLMTGSYVIHRTPRLTTIVIGLAISLATSLPAQGTTQYGPFRITAGRSYDIGLNLKRGEYFAVVANGLMQHYQQQHWANGYQQQNGHIAGKLHVLSGEFAIPVGTAGNGQAQVDGSLTLAVIYAQQVHESDATVAAGAFYVYVTAPAGRCTQLDCGFKNGAGVDLTADPTGAGNVVTWSPNLYGILTAGYQLGIAGVGAVNRAPGDETLRYVDERLRMARANAESAPLNVAGIDALISSLGQTRNAASIAPQITAVGDSYQQAVNRTCVCGGVRINPSWIFSAGRQLAYAEAATYLNLTPQAMYAYLASLREACVNSGGILPIDGIDGLMRMLNSTQPSGLAAALAGPREQLFAAAARPCVCY
jgi:hypothetical protein